MVYFFTYNKDNILLHWRAKNLCGFFFLIPYLPSYINQDLFLDLFKNTEKRSLKPAIEINLQFRIYDIIKLPHQ